MFYAPRECHDRIAGSLGGLRRITLNFEREGSKIIFVHD